MNENPTALLPQSVIRNLPDKLYEKRKNAALEVESIVKQLSSNGDQDRVGAIINILVHDFALSPHINHRKGGLIGLAAATVGLAGEASQHLEKIVPPVLKSFQDQDSRVRYYACEALYNIAKVSRGDFILFFNDVFDSLCKLSADSDMNVQNAAHLLDRLVKDIVTESDQFSIEEFIPLLRERMHVLSPNVRQFLVGWITVLDSVPDIDMLGFLPDFLDGLFNMLGDSAHEIRVQADSALREFLQEIKNAPSVEYGRMAEILVQRAASSEEFTRLTAITWIHEFVKLGGSQLSPYAAAILGATLPCISDKEEKIRAVAKETNDEQLSQVGPQSISDGFDIGAVLSVLRRELGSEWEATRLEALSWVSVLLETFRPEVLSFLDDPSILLFNSLLQVLSDESEEVVLLTLEVLANVARDPHNFSRLLLLLTQRFHMDRTLLEKRGSLAIRQLCQLSDAERLYRELAIILEREAKGGGEATMDLDFVTVMVQALNLILLTAAELADLRALLKRSLLSSDGSDLFTSLYATWSHSVVTTVSLCLLAQAYDPAALIVSSLGEEDITVNLLVQVDKLVQLLETPIFAYLRMQLLEPLRFPSLLKTLYGLLMLLPQQSGAFTILRTRLESVPTQAYMQIPPSQATKSPLSLQPPFSPSEALISGENSEAYSVIGEVASPSNGTSGIVDFQEKLKDFDKVQEMHRLHRREALKSQKRIPAPVTSNGNPVLVYEESVVSQSGRSVTQPSDEESYISQQDSRIAPRRTGLRTRR